MLARFDSRPQVRRSESWRRCKQDDITSFNHLLVGVEADEFERVVNGDLSFGPFVGLQAGEAAFDRIRTDVGDRDELRLRVCLQSLTGRSCSATTASDEADFQLVAACREDARIQTQLHSQSTCDHRTGLEEIPS